MYCKCVRNMYCLKAVRRGTKKGPEIAAILKVSGYFKGDRNITPYHVTYLDKTSKNQFENKTHSF